MKLYKEEGVMKEPKICPMCGREYSDYPALSRKDNETLICPECGQREALESIGVIDRNEQDHIIGLSRSVMDEMKKGGNYEF